MFNKTNMAKSDDGKHGVSLMASAKVADEKISLTNRMDAIQNHVGGYLKRLSLEKQVTIFAIAISTIPALVVGAIAYNFTHKSFTKQINQSQTTTAVGLAEQVNRYMLERYGDIQVLSNLPLFADGSFINNNNTEEKQAFLNKILKAYKAYNSIAVFNTEGKLIVQSTGETPDTQTDSNSVQETLQKDVTVISKPATSANIYLTAPVKDTLTQKTLAVIRTSLPTKSLQEVIQNYTTYRNQFALIDNSGKVFLSSQKELLGKEAKTEYPGLAKLITTNNISTLTTVSKNNQKQQLVSYVPARNLQGLPNLNWQLLLATDTAILYGNQQQLLGIVVTGIAIIGAIVAAIATWLIKRTTSALTQQKQDEPNTRLASPTEDELGELSTNHAALQLQLLELLNDIEGAARGDLTVRAEVTDGEIGTVADFFNSIVENLRDIVTQVKQAATQVNTAISADETAIRQLADDALVQAGEITRALDAVDNMTHAMQTVANSAEQAATVAHNAAQNASKSEEAMYLTVQNILSLRETVGETAHKVKRLGESSQQISRVVSLINQIAMQTNLLAINAGIEAARAGEEGQGFAVVAEEVGELAVRSAAATQEIEQIVDNIQRETSAVVQAIEIGTSQVGEGARVVEEAKQNLGQIFDLSRQIDSLVQSISSATASQVQTSQTVSLLMKDIAAISQRTSDSSSLVCQSLKQTVEISHKLQETVETFKVN